MHEHIVLCAAGASTAVGRDALSSAAAVRAGISNFVFHPYMSDSSGVPVRVAAAPWLDPDLMGHSRFEALLFPALDQVLEACGFVRVAPQKVALALGLPNTRPGLPADLEKRLLATIEGRYGSILDQCVAFPTGHAAGLLALDAAVRALANKKFDACVVAAVDSYIDPVTLHWLEANDQLHGAGPLENAWGFIPGEAAGAVLLARENMAATLKLTPWTSILGTGAAVESNRRKIDTVCVGDGLTQAFQSALIALPPGEVVTDVYCDMNGEPYRADEFGFATMRRKASFRAASKFIAPASSWGDVAAAGGPLHLMLAAIAGNKRYANGPLALVWASSESGQRAAALLKTAMWA